MRLLIVMALSMAFVTSAGAQSASQLRVGLFQVERPETVRARIMVARGSLPRTYWAEGMAIGGVIGLIGGLELQHGFAQISDGGDATTWGHIWFLIPTVLFGIIGGLIGSGIHKH